MAKIKKKTMNNTKIILIITVIIIKIIIMKLDAKILTLVVSQSVTSYSIVCHQFPYVSTNESDDVIA